MEKEKQKDPAFLFYSSDFLTGTALFSFEQRGIYIFLLCLQHQQGGICDDDMINICGTHVKHIIKKFEKREDGLYYNIRLEKEVIKRSKYSESRRVNRTGKVLKTKKPRGVRTYVPHMENEIENEIIVLYSVHFTHTWLDWKKYKYEQHAFKFKSVDSELKSLRLLHKESLKNESLAIAMLDYAMAKGWQSWVVKDAGFYTTETTADHPKIRYEDTPEFKS